MCRALPYARGVYPAPALVFALCLCFVPLSSVSRRHSGRTGSGVALSLFLSLFLFLSGIPGAGGGAGPDR
jgi:lipopolysaccharide export LptBFGC system permease protein LptF